MPVMPESENPDSQVRPPTAIKVVYKNFQKLDSKLLDSHPDIIDLNTNGDAKRSSVRRIPFRDLPRELHAISEDVFVQSSQETVVTASTAATTQQASVFEIASIPGLYIYPSLLSQNVQLDLLDKLLHRDLCNPNHNTNLHLHYNVPYPPRLSHGTTASYFDSLSKDLIFRPQDPTLHRPLTTQQVLSKKLRWMTLGGQYDWTNKVYPSTSPPEFPFDIKTMIEDVFPMKAEAAIVNLYSPGDTLSLHRDISEECDQPLVSISLGCDGMFVIGLDDVDEDGRPRVEVARLRSGDAVLMSGKSRYAWHGVPKVLAETCPEWMESWPGVASADQSRGEESNFAEWKDWMKGKRINLNVRQMFDEKATGI